MRVAVTGASGFIGGKVVHYLLAEGHKVVSVGRTDPKIKGVEHKDWGLIKKVNAIVHCAGSAGDWMTDEEAEEMKTVNLDLTARAMDINPDARFIFMSSSSVYQTRSDVFEPVEELVKDDAQMLSPYALSKALSEHLVSKVRDKSKNYYILRPRAVYGPGDKTLLPRVDEYAHGFCILPGKNPKASFTNIESLCKVVGFFVDDYKGEHFGIYNVADGSVEGTHELIALIAKLRGKNCTPVSVPYRIAYKAATVMENKARKKGTSPEATRYLASQLGRESIMDTSKLEKTMGYGLPATDVSQAGNW